MKDCGLNLLKKLNPSAERWAVIVAVLSVALLAAFLMIPKGGDSRLIMETPGRAHAALMDSDHDNDDPAEGVEYNQNMENDPDARYACPMMCIPPAEQPGDCPVCGMALMPVESHAHGTGNGAPRLRLSAQAVHLADIRTASVQRMPVTAEVRLFGRIDFDSAHITTITAFMPGVIDRVYIKRAGQFVRWGDPLFDIYSSDLLETQRQLVEAMQYVPGFLAFQANSPHVAQDMPVQTRKKSGHGEQRSQAQKEALQKIAALRHKLSILGLPKRDIDQFMRKGEATGIATVYAPMYGQITVQNATEGTFVNTGASLFTIADPKYVWARLDAYESDYPWVRIGQHVTFTTEAYPGEMFEAKVVYIDPVFDATTRTFSIGAISTEDQGGRLKAGMLVRAVAHAQLNAGGKISTKGAAPKTMPLVIPDSAPLITGKRAVVYVSVPGEEPVFEGREVVLGPRAKGHYIVNSGLAEGEQVVVNGNFKIDSAMQISARPSLMSPLGGRPMNGHAHHGVQAQAEVRARHANAAPKAASPAQSSLIDKHQHTGLADQMHEHYMNERQYSRMVTESEEMSEDHGSHDVRQQTNNHVSRRKPGSYGDTTRQGASLLEEHRKKWRKP